MTLDGSPKVEILIPFRTDHNGPRDRACNWIIKRWGERTLWDVRLGGVSPDEPWSKSHGVRAALNKSTADVLIIADADVWIDERSMHDAVFMVESGRTPWAIPHGPVHRLTETATERVYETDVLGGAWERPPYLGMPGGGLVVISRGLYEEAPFDPRFVGWGHEDESASYAWETLGGRPWRGTSVLWHLWHEPQPKISLAVGSPESKYLLNRFRTAYRNHEKMRALINEAKVEV